MVLTKEDIERLKRFGIYVNEISKEKKRILKLNDEQRDKDWLNKINSRPRKVKR